MRILLRIISAGILLGRPGAELQPRLRPCVPERVLQGLREKRNFAALVPFRNSVFVRELEFKFVLLRFEHSMRNAKERRVFSKRQGVIEINLEGVLFRIPRPFARASFRATWMST